MDGRLLDTKKLERAQSKYGKENVMLADDLIEYADELKPAMRHVFGRAVVCMSDSVAKGVTFDEDIRVRSVTLDGTEYNPAGVVTGGARANRTVLLSELNEVMKKTDHIMEIDKKVEKLQGYYYFLLFIIVIIYCYYLLLFIIIYCYYLLLLLNWVGA
ncbi:unnamed protein product [Anisakis simplex]|uniref:Structural maintenance of chromosomes protein 2 (inferred by orthology to a human protein) n=1 Tax=Anisakis simplex TaxID=6269 RepID=A0A0M3KHQ4_ANISI|nr:unnamed protein product [Anisakis simplex]